MGCGWWEGRGEGGGGRIIGKWLSYVVDIIGAKPKYGMSNFVKIHRKRQNKIGQNGAGSFVVGRAGPAAIFHWVLCLMRGGDEKVPLYRTSNNYQTVLESTRED